MQKTNLTNKVLVAIVSFNPDLKLLSALLKKLSQEVVDIQLIDNASNNQAQVEDLCSEFPTISFLSLKKNLGIAKAQNLSIEKAIAEKFPYIAFFDQDSELPTAYIRDQLIALKEISQVDEDIAAIAPIFIDKKTRFIYPIIRITKWRIIKSFINLDSIESEKFHLASLLISSGMVVDVKVFQKIGGMNEKFFIDHVDTEWCFRARNGGYRLYVNPRKIMDHSVGERTIKFLGFNLPGHNPIRGYYASRNLFNLIFRNRNPFIWKIKEFFGSLPKAAVLIYFGDNKLIRIKCYYFGMLDGILGKFDRKFLL